MVEDGEEEEMIGEEEEAEEGLNWYKYVFLNNIFNV